LSFNAALPKWQQLAAGLARRLSFNAALPKWQQLAAGLARRLPFVPGRETRHAG
jgi:hypothetical protein